MPEKKPRRFTQQIYYDILTSIEASNEDTLKLVPLQQKTGLAYDKISSHITKMRDLDLVHPAILAITKKGFEFMEEIKAPLNSLNKITAKYLDEEQASAKPRQSTREYVLDMQSLLHIKDGIINHYEEGKKKLEEPSLKT